MKDTFENNICDLTYHVLEYNKSNSQEEEIGSYIKIFNDSSIPKQEIIFLHDSLIVYLESKKLPYKAEYKKLFKKALKNCSVIKSLELKIVGEKEIIKELEFDKDTTIFLKSNKEIENIIEKYKDKIHPVVNVQKFDNFFISNEVKFKNFKKFTREMYLNYVNYKTLGYKMGHLVFITFK